MPRPTQNPRKLTDLLCNEQSVLQQVKKENGADMDDVGFKCGGKDQDVIQVDKNKLSQEISENVVNERLEDRGGIGQTEQHQEVFIMT